MQKSIVYMIIIMIGARAIGFLKSAAMASYFGTSYIVDSFTMASGIPTIVFGMFLSMYEAVPPFYMSAKATGGKGEADKFMSGYILLFLSLAFAGVVVTLLFSNPITSVIALGFSEEALELTKQYLYLCVWISFCSGLGNLLSEYLRCNGFYSYSQGAELLLAAIQLLATLFAGYFGFHYLALTNLVASCVYILFLSYKAYRLKFRFRLQFVDRSILEKLIHFLFPIFIGTMLSDINLFVDRYFVAKMQTGSVASLQYGVTVRNLFLMIFTAITLFIYPHLSALASEKRLSAFGAYLNKIIKIIMVLYIPILVGMLLLSNTLIRFLFMGGKFNEQSVNMTVAAFRMYAVGVLPLAVQGILTRTLFALQDVKYISVVSAIAVAANVFMNFIFAAPMQQAGIALATSLSFLVSIPFLVRIIKRHLVTFGGKEILKTIWKSTIAAVFMGTIVFIINDVLNGIFGTVSKVGLFMNLIFSFLSGCISYFAGLWVMRSEELSLIYKCKDKSV